MGGIPIDQIDAKDFANVISFIDQKIVLFNATIAENLSLWNSTITFDQLTKAFVSWSKVIVLFHNDKFSAMVALNKTIF